jgi:hypothetical protein
MSFETFALIWPFIGIALAIGGVMLYIRFFEARIDSWLDRRKSR